MSFFIADAMADAGAAAPQAANPMSFWVMMILMVVIFYFMIIRPQSKRNKEHKALIDALGKGDEVVVAGGMMGKVVKVSDEYVVVDVANNTEISFQKAAITATLPKGTLKGIRSAE